MEVDVLNKKGEVTGKIELPPEIFSLKFNPALVHQVMRWQTLNTYYPYAHTKIRSEVKGSGRKPWPQKHTGRARHGSRRSPLWRGGGVTFGPRKENVKQIKINKKMKRKAILMTIAKKFQDKLMKVFEDLSFSGKTKEAFSFLANFLKETKTKKKRETALLVIPDNDKKTFRSVRNLPFADVIEARNVNVLSLLNHKYLFLTPKSIDIIKETFVRK